VSAPRLGALALFILAVPAFVYAAACIPTVGAPVMLKSDPADPDVIVWDSRERLVAYVEGHWNSSQEVMTHTVLAEPGTHAQVVACYPGIARLKYGNGQRNAVGVRLTSGAFRGHYGWVISSDVHIARTAFGGS
jgi:hypothetical protein